MSLVTIRGGHPVPKRRTVSAANAGLHSLGGPTNRLRIHNLSAAPNHLRVYFTEAAYTANGADYELVLAGTVYSEPVALPAPLPGVAPGNPAPIAVWLRRDAGDVDCVITPFRRPA